MRVKKVGVQGKINCSQGNPSLFYINMNKSRHVQIINTMVKYNLLQTVLQYALTYFLLLVAITPVWER